MLQNSNDFLGGYVRWFTGLPALFGYPRCILFFGPGDMVVVEQGAERGDTSPDQTATAFAGIARQLTSPSFTSVKATEEVDALIAARVLRERSCRRIGWVNPASACFGFGRTLEKALAECVFADATDAIDEFKAVKSVEEQELIRRTCALQDQVVSDVVDFIRPGHRDFEVAAYAQYRTQQLGSEQGLILASSSPAGKAAVFKPRFAQGRTLEAGDVFSLLVEVNGPGGLYAEIGRTLSLGSPAPELVAANREAVAAQEHTLRLLLPGAKCAEIFARHNDYMEARGLPPEQRLYAHSQGYDLVERPLIRHDEPMEIREGMNIVVHPGFVTQKAFGIVCDNYLIGPEGPIALHKYPKEIIQV